MEKLQLEYFLSVAKTLNMTKSAEELYISQSSLSQTIKRLEKEIGYPLFDRNGKHISLNDNGLIFLKCVNRMKDTFINAMEEIRERNNVENREISINMQCASYFLPQLILYLGERLGNISFQISQQNYEIAKGEKADLMIIATSEPLDSSCASLLLEEEILLAVPQNHALAKQKNIAISDLAAEKFVSLNPSWSLEQVIRAQCEKQAFYPNVSIRVDNPDVLRRLLGEQLGLAFVPEITWGKSFAEGVIELRLVSDISMKRYVYIVWNEGFVRENVKQCISHIKEFFHRLSTEGITSEIGIESEFNDRC